MTNAPTMADFMRYCQSAANHAVPVDWHAAAQIIYNNANQAMLELEKQAAHAAVTEEVLRGLLPKPAAEKADKMIEDALAAAEKAKGQ